MPQDNYSDRVITGEVVPPSSSGASDSETPDEDSYPQTFLHKVASARPASGPPPWPSPADDPEEEDMPEEVTYQHSAPEDTAPSEAAPSDTAPSEAAPSEAAPSDTAPDQVAHDETLPAADDMATEPAAEAELQPGRDETVHDETASETTDPDLMAPVDPAVQDPAVQDPAVQDSDAQDSAEDEQRGRHRADVPMARVPESGESTTAEPTTAEPGLTRPEAVTPVPPARRPGDETVPPEMAGKLMTDAAEVREQWMRVQAAFVDDPRMAVNEASNLINDVVARLQAAVQERQRALRGRWDGGTQADTESLRVTMQQYRALMERLAGL